MSKKEWLAFASGTMLLVVALLMLQVHNWSSIVVAEYFNLNPVSRWGVFELPLVSQFYVLYLATKGYGPATALVLPIVAQVLAPGALMLHHKVVNSN